MSAWGCLLKGCLPRRGCLLGGRGLLGMPIGGVCPGGVCPGRCLLGGRGVFLGECVCLGSVCQIPPPVDRMTETGVKTLLCRNYVADGKCDATLLMYMKTFKL